MARFTTSFFKLSKKIPSSKSAARLQRLATKHKLPEINIGHIRTKTVGKTKSMFINNHSVKDLAKSMRKGDIDSVLGKMYPGIKVPNAVRMKLQTEIKLNAANRYETMRNNFKAKVEKHPALDGMSAKDKKLITDPSSTARIDQSFLNRNPKLKAFLNKAVPSKKTSALGIALVGGIGAIGASMVTEHQRKLNGCQAMWVSKTTGNMESCKVANGSCENGKLQTNANKNMCGINIKLPDHLKNDADGQTRQKACNDCKTEGYHCTTDCAKKIPKPKVPKQKVNANDPTPANSSSSSDSESNDDDNMTFTCINASWLESLNDMRGEYTEKTTNVFESIGNGFATIMHWFMGAFKYILSAIAVIAVVCAAGYSYTTIRKANLIETYDNSTTSGKINLLKA